MTPEPANIEEEPANPNDANTTGQALRPAVEAEETYKPGESNSFENFDTLPGLSDELPDLNIPQPVTPVAQAENPYHQEVQEAADIIEEYLSGTWLDKILGAESQQDVQKEMEIALVNKNTYYRLLREDPNIALSIQRELHNRRDSRQTQAQEVQPLLADEQTVPVVVESVDAQPHTSSSPEVGFTFDQVEQAALMAATSGLDITPLNIQISALISDEEGSFSLYHLLSSNPIYLAAVEERVKEIREGKTTDTSEQTNASLPPWLQDEDTDTDKQSVEPEPAVAQQPPQSLGIRRISEGALRRDDYATRKRNVTELPLSLQQTKTLQEAINTEPVNGENNLNQHMRDAEVPPVFIPHSGDHIYDMLERIRKNNGRLTSNDIHKLMEESSDAEIPTLKPGGEDDDRKARKQRIINAPRDFRDQIRRKLNQLGTTLQTTLDATLPVDQSQIPGRVWNKVKEVAGRKQRKHEPAANQPETTRPQDRSYMSIIDRVSQVVDKGITWVESIDKKTTEKVAEADAALAERTGKKVQDVKESGTGQLTEIFASLSDLQKRFLETVDEKVKQKSRGELWKEKTKAAANYAWETIKSQPGQALIVTGLVTRAVLVDWLQIVDREYYDQAKLYVPLALTGLTAFTQAIEIELLRRKGTSYGVDKVKQGLGVAASYVGAYAIGSSIEQVASVGIHALSVQNEAQIPQTTEKRTGVNQHHVGAVALPESTTTIPATSTEASPFPTIRPEYATQMADPNRTPVGATPDVGRFVQPTPHPTETPTLVPSVTVEPTATVHQTEVPAVQIQPTPLEQQAVVTTPTLEQFHGGFAPIASDHGDRTTHARTHHIYMPAINHGSVDTAVQPNTEVPDKRTHEPILDSSAFDHDKTSTGQLDGSYQNHDLTVTREIDGQKVILIMHQDTSGNEKLEHLIDAHRKDGFDGYEVNQGSLEKKLDQALHIQYVDGWEATMKKDPAHKEYYQDLRKIFYYADGTESMKGKLENPDTLAAAHRLHVIDFPSEQIHPGNPENANSGKQLMEFAHRNGLIPSTNSVEDVTLGTHHGITGSTVDADHPLTELKDGNVIPYHPESQVVSNTRDILSELSKRDIVVAGYKVEPMFASTYVQMILEASQNGNLNLSHEEIAKLLQLTEKLKIQSLSTSELREFLEFFRKTGIVSVPREL